MSDFLGKGYEIPEPPSNYMSLEEGTNQFRVLSSAIVGFEYWTEDAGGKRRPHRVKTSAELPTDIETTAKHFWAFVVYNYETKSVQILELTQVTIQRAIKALVANPKWGDPKEYDLVVTKTRTGNLPRDVEYSVMPEPKEPVDPGIVKAYEDMAINLEALYEDGDPFAAGKQAEAAEIADAADKALNT
jgi:hypothetical protein